MFQGNVEEPLPSAGTVCRSVTTVIFYFKNFYVLKAKDTLKRRTMSIPTADNVVFNLSLYNDKEFSIPAEIYLSRDQPFINNIENYYIRLLSAEISTAEIPFFDYKSDMFLDINGTNVLVTFDILFSDVPNSVVFLTQFLNGVNRALQTAHITSGAPGNPPLFIYEAEQVKLVVDQVYTPGVDTISMNEILIGKFPTFMTKYNPVGNIYTLQYGQFGNNVFNTYPGGINYPVYVISANSTLYPTLPEFTSLAVTTSSIPINRQQITAVGVSTRTLGILDIIPLTFDDVTKYTIKFYNQEYPQYNDLLSRGKLSEIDFKIYLVDINFNLRPLYIPPKTTAACRIEFVNKEIVKNFYPGEKSSRSF